MYVPPTYIMSTIFELHRYIMQMDDVPTSIVLTISTFSILRKMCVINVAGQLSEAAPEPWDEVKQMLIYNQPRPSL